MAALPARRDATISLISPEIVDFVARYISFADRLEVHQFIDNLTVKANVEINR